MTTTAAFNTSDTVLPSDNYPDDFLGPRDSPDLKPLHPTLRPSPSPESSLPPGPVSPPPKSGRRRRSNKPKVHPSQGDAVLVSLLDGGRNPDLARTAGLEALPSDPDERYDDDDEDDSETGSDGSETESSDVSSVADDRRTAERQDKMAVDTARAPSGGGAFDLKSLAAGALAVAVNEPKPDAGERDERAAGAGVGAGAGGRAGRGASADMRSRASPREGPRPEPLPSAIATRRDARLPAENPVLAATAAAAARSPYSPSSVSSPGDASQLSVSRLALRSPPGGFSPNGMPQAENGNLPPISSLSALNSPAPDGGDRKLALPSIHAQFGDLNQLNMDAARDFERSRRRTTMPYLGPSSPAGIARFSTVPTNLASPPPVSPNGLRRDHASPDHAYAAGVPSPFYYPGAAHIHRSHHTYSSGTAETPSTEHSASTPATSVTTDRMSIDGLAHPQQSSLFICRFAGCNAPPFHTQYLLNSHANVHSSARPHYCPVKGCPRSEGGKGFKRKNEMIRHGLVHDSPGYVCPFCPDREHKYPRPDNLQRHVRVHHVDKDKDDGLLRDVLAQRPDGPSRGRRRRGGPT